MNRERIHQILKDELSLARKRLEQASTAFNEVLADIPSGIPHPDGTQRIKNCANVAAQAREDLMIATRRLNNFVLDSTVPDDLRDE